MNRKNHKACLFEEICLINLYGTPHEKDVLNRYINTSKDELNELFIISSKIKKRIKSGNI